MRIASLVPLLCTLLLLQLAAQCQAEAAAPNNKQVQAGDEEEAARRRLHGSIEDAICEAEYGGHCPVGWDYLTAANKGRGCDRPPCCAPTKGHPGNSKCTTIQHMAPGGKWQQGSPPGLAAKQAWEVTCGIYWPAAKCPSGWPYSPERSGTCSRPPSYKGTCNSIVDVDSYSPQRKYAWSQTCNPPSGPKVEWVCPNHTPSPSPSPHPGPPPPPPANPNTEAEEVFIVFGNHLDVGYTGEVRDVINEYIDRYVERAMDTAAQFRTSNETVAKGWTYTWLGFSFILDILLHCNETTVNSMPGRPSNLQCPNATTLARINTAIAAGPEGGISWPAFPHNGEPEMYSPEFFEVAINLTHKLDTRFGKTPRMTYSQRDVPGLTRGVLPLLSKLGVKAISVGENDCPRPLAFFDGDNTSQWPTKVFKWQDPASGASALTIMHPHGYGGITQDDCAYVNASKTALCTSWRGDNQGPHEFTAALQVYQRVQAEFPNAKIRASDAFDDFVAKVLPVQHTLPVLTHEMGDSWIYGASTDPIKVATTRAAMRVRTQCAEAGQWREGNDAEATFDRLLIKSGEHTWGTSGGKCKKVGFNNSDLTTGSDPAFPQAMPASWPCVDAWYEQRMFILNAVQALVAGKSPCAPPMTKAMAEISPSWASGKWSLPPQTSAHAAAWKSVPFVPGQRIKTANAGVTLAFNAAGGITHLDTGGGGAAAAANQAQAAPLASAANPLAEFHYQTLSGNQMHDWVTAYGTLSRPNYGNFAAPGEATSGSSIGATGYNATGTVTAMAARENDDGSSEILLNLTLPEKAWKEGGAPRRLSVLYTATKNTSALTPLYTLDISLRTLEKTPTKHKETMWLSFAPPCNETEELQLEIDKLGSWIDPADVLPFPGSSMHLHAVNSGARWQRNGGGTALELISQDVALVSVGERNPAPTPRVDGGTHYGGGRLTPDPAGGVHFSLVNNIWNTNYPFWYPWQLSDQDTQYRFTLRFGAA